MARKEFAKSVKPIKPLNIYMFYRNPWFGLMFLLTSMMSLSVHGDAIVVTKAMSASTIAEVFVADESVRVLLEVGAADLEAFKNLLPDELYDKLELADAQPYEQRIDRFFSKDMVVQADSIPLVGKILQLTARRRVLRDEVTGKPLANQPDAGEVAGEVVVYAELQYTFEGRPKTITIQPPTNEAGNRVTANVGFITYHRGLPVMDFRYLSQTETLELDWDDPWYSSFQNRNLRRQFDAPLSVFLYVEPFEVRVEVVARPVDLQRWTDLGVRDRGIIQVSEQAGLKSSVADFLSDKIEVAINGQGTDGSLDRIHFINRTLRKTGVVYPDQDLDASSATLGVIFVFPIEELPDLVTMNWRLFDEKIKSIPAVATDEAGGLPSTLTADEPILSWKNFLTHPTIPAMLAIQSPPARPQISIPWASFGLLFVAGLAGLRLFQPENRGYLGVAIAVLVISITGAFWTWPHARFQVANPLIGQPQVTDEQAMEVTHSLLHNLYRSFDRRDESLIYDRLATCVSGDLLREIYMQIRQRIKLADQGGAQVKINDVDMLEAEFKHREDSPGFKAKVTWNVMGSIGHWGHLHTRANQYVAELGIEPVDGAWKIVALQITDEVNLGAMPVK
jgi:hypothetical protein